MKFDDFVWDSDMVYPVLFLPKKCATIAQNYKFADDIFILLSIRSLDVEGKYTNLYSGYCNIKLIERCDIHVHDIQPLLTPDPKSLHHVEVLSDQTSQDPLFFPYTQSQVWIDPLRSPFIYNDCNTNGSQGKCSIHHQSQSNHITVNHHNTYITQNVYNYAEPLDELDNSKFKKIASVGEITLPNITNETELDDLYENDDFEYEMFLSQLPDEIANDNIVKDTEEVIHTELQTENDALKQLMSPGIQSMSKQQKTILFLGNEPLYGQTVQKIAVNDPSVECIETEIEHGVNIEQKTCSSQKKYQCEKCKQIFGQLVTFKQHMVSHRNKTAPCVTEDEINLTCTLCNKKMKNREKYEIHCAGHGDPELECGKCFKVFASKFSLRTHRKLHMRKYPCDLCTKSFSKQVELKAHFAKTHSVYKCDLCHYTTHEQKELKTHQNSHMECLESDEQEPGAFSAKRQNDIVCANDEKEQFKSSKAQKRSKKSIAEEEKVRDADMVIAKIMSNKVFLLHSKAARKEKRFNKSCDVCTKSFDRIGDLKRHLIEHVVNSTLAKNPVDKNGTLSIQCEVCREKTFTKTDKYKEHLREHAKLTLYQCAICNKSFSDSSNFSKHKKIHGSQYFQCDLCQRKFNSKKMITQHMDYHTKNSPLECSYCDKVFYFESMLNKHVKCAHVKETSTRFRCRFCHQYYKSLKEKWDHEWYVHNVRKVVADCFVCDAKFRKYAELKRHCNAFHNIDIPSAKKLEELNQP